MVLEESANGGYTSSEGRYAGGNTESTYPPAMGPGARTVGSSYTPAMGPGAIMSSQPEFGEKGERAPGSMLQQIQEIRSHYSFEVRDQTLFLGYDLRGAARRYTLPFANMPLSGPSVWLLYGGPLRTRVTSTFVIDTIRGAENLANRPLTQREAEGYAHHASRRTLYSFASSISALGIGSGMAIWNRNTMKFPFRKPQPLERYNNFPNRWMPLLTGNPAKLMWHITRVNVYVVLCLALLAPLYSSMGDSAMMVGLYKDPRTHDVTKGMATALKDSGGRLKRLATSKDEAAQGQLGPVEGGDNDNFYASSEEGAANDYSDGKDFGGDAAYTDGSTDTGLPGDSQMQRREARQRSPSSFTGNPAFRHKPVRQPEGDVDASAEPNLIFDDASPTAGNNAGMGSDYSSSGSGSAWERVRKGQADLSNKRGITPPGVRSSQSASKRTQTPHDVPQDDFQTDATSFSISSRDAEKQFAKEQAQKEFDKMLDEERKGVDGGASAGAGGAWDRRRGE